MAKAILLAAALGAADFALSAAWAVPLDIAPDHAGVVTGWMNSLGNLGGLFGPLVVGFVVAEYDSWVTPFYLAAGIYAIGAVAWLAIDPTTPIEPGAITAAT